jgi:hypothetical protein
MPEVTLADMPPEGWVVVSENRRLAGQNGKMVDSFAPYEVHIYTTDDRLGELEPIGPLRRKIDEAQAAGVKPGNILYRNLNMKIVMSSGDAYDIGPVNVPRLLIDGMADPEALGWRNSKGAPMPQMVQMTFNQPQTIGRIVMFTENLKAYSLSVLSDGKWQTVAAEADCDQQVVDVKFAPRAVAAIKVEVNEARQGDQATIREIEAYAE